MKRKCVQGGMKMELRGKMQRNQPDGGAGVKMSQTGHFERIMTVIIRTWTELNCLLHHPCSPPIPLPSG